MKCTAQRTKRSKVFNKPWQISQNNIFFWSFGNFIYPCRMKTIIRHGYLDFLWQLHDKNFIKVVTGVRRSGKSTLLQQFQDVLREKKPEASILSINMDILEYRFLAEKNYHGLRNRIAQRYKAN